MAWAGLMLQALGAVLSVVALTTNETQRYALVVRLRGLLGQACPWLLLLSAFTMGETGLVAMLIRLHQTPPGTLFHPTVMTWAPMPLAIVAVKRAQQLRKAQRKSRLRLR